MFRGERSAQAEDTLRVALVSNDDGERVGLARVDVALDRLDLTADHEPQPADLVEDRARRATLAGQP